ncbi:MAG: restriction endonuclease subunit S [Verrucomicrobiota bacterium]
MPAVPELPPRFWCYVHAALYAGKLNYPAIKQTTGIQNLDSSAYLDTPAPFPGISEQRAIAAFLDRETGRVDRLVAKKQQLIERLKEKRTAIISDCVTGKAEVRTKTNPDGTTSYYSVYPSVLPQKPSGLDWLGDIPAHWQVKKLGYGAWLQGGYAFASETFDSEGVPVVRMNNLKRGVLDTSEANCIPPNACLQDFALRKGDLLWGMSGSIGETGSLGNFARVRAHDLPAQLNQRVGRFHVFQGSYSLDFLTYVIQTKMFYDQILLRVTGTAQFNVSSEQVQSVKVPFPLQPEQAAIAAYLDVETAKLDAMAAKVETAVERLQEYRTALITAAVTGKIDVRKAAA